MRTAVVTRNYVSTLGGNFQTAGMKFHQTLKNEPWGARNFIVEDPDGNLILFAGSAD